MKRMTSETSSVVTNSLPSNSHSLPVSTQTSSPLFRLPRELRDRIYQFALCAEHDIHWPVEQFKASFALPLIFTSRTIHNEATPVLYSVNRFTFSHPSDLNMFVKIFDPENTRKIANLHLKVRDRDLRAFWTSYLSSTASHRSLSCDVPGLKHLDISLRSSWWMSDPERAFMSWTENPVLRHLCLSLEENTIPTSVNVKITSAHKIPKRDMVLLVDRYKHQLKMRNPDQVKTRWREYHGADIRLELEVVPSVSGGPGP